MKDFIILVKLNNENGLELAKQSYKDIYNNIMSTGKIKINPTFLGGNPVTIEKDNFSTLVKNEYMVSAKADGLRFLLMIGNKTRLNNRGIYFIDRNSDFWVLTHNMEPIPAISNIANCLLDGELVMWGDITVSDEQIQITSKGKQKPLVIYSTFDVLYGPTNPSFETNQGHKEPMFIEGNFSSLVENPAGIGKMKLNLGSTGGFMGPKGGYRWPWKKRYFVLKTMITNRYSPLFMYNSNNNYFKIVLSPFIPLRDVLLSQDPEEYMIDEYHKYISMQFPEIPHTIRKMTDGLIFTPANKDYIQGAWKFCDNELYKWKPTNKLTVDLQVGKFIEKENEVYKYKALCRTGKKLKDIGFIYAPKKTIIKEYKTNTPNKKTIKNKIVECLWLSDNKFKFLKPRHDKITPNAENTITSVINSINNPISLETLSYVYKNGLYNIINKGTKEQKKQIIDQIGYSSIIRHVLIKRPELLFEKRYLDNLKRIIIQTKRKRIEENKQDSKTHHELESRLKIPYLGKSLYNCIIQKLWPGAKKPVAVLKKYGILNNFKEEEDKNKSIRSSEVILGLHLVPAITEIKEKIRSVSTKQTNTMKLAKYDIIGIDTYLSSETKVSDSTMFPITLYRYQVRFEIDPLPSSDYGKTPSLLWRIDITEYGESKESPEQARKNYNKKPFTQIEIEYAPTDQENNMFEYYLSTQNTSILHEMNAKFNYKLSNPTVISVQKAMEVRSKKLENLPVEFIIKDYCKTVLWVLQLVYGT